MDFFAQQEKARRNTTLLIGYFIAGMTGLIVTLYLASVVIFYGALLHHGRYRSYDRNLYQNVELTWWKPQLFAFVALGTLAIIIIGSIIKSLELASGGSAVADMMEGELVPPNTTDPDERKLLNIVEEMAIASGVPVPSVYIMRNETAINAFAAGHSTGDAVVCVTRGAIKLLTRDELQGVIGHEFSHILNGDMRLNLRLMGIIFGIVCLTFIGRVLLRSNDRKNALPLFGLVLIIVGWVGSLFGQLIRAAVSRQREFLADASSVQFTRNPAGLAGALKKIGGLSFGSRLDANHASEASHMFFSNGIEPPLFDLFATHPPLAERIKTLDPAFDGQFPHVGEMVEVARTSAPSHPYIDIIPNDDLPGGLADLGRIMPTITATAAMAHTGKPAPAHLHYAQEFRQNIPDSIRQAAREPFGASALIYALLISTDATERDQQLALVAQNTSEAIRAETGRILPDVTSIASHAKLPLVDLALPALRQLSPDQYQQFKKTLDPLIESDGQVDLFEYMLRKIVLRHLDTKFFGARKPSIQYYSLKGVSADCDILLSALAYAGQEDPAKVLDAFQQGAAFLARIVQINFNLLPADQCDLEQTDAALNRLDQAVPQIKKNIINACAQVVAADGIIQESEAELLRTIAETLDCPMPPFVQP